MRSIKVWCLGVFVTCILSGCGIVPVWDLKAKEAEINEYNKLVEDTLDYYIKSKTFAINNKEDLMNFILYDKSSDLFSEHKLTKLTKEQLEAFKIHGVIYDEYFTALKAEGVREILIINGRGYRMYVTVIWGKDKVHYISRVVNKI